MIVKLSGFDQNLFCFSSKVHTAKSRKRGDSDKCQVSDTTFNRSHILLQTNSEIDLFFPSPKTCFYWIEKWELAWSKNRQDRDGWNFSDSTRWRVLEDDGKGSTNNYDFWYSLIELWCPLVSGSGQSRLPQSTEVSDAISGACFFVR